MIRRPDGHAATADAAPLPFSGEPRHTIRPQATECRASASRMTRPPKLWPTRCTPAFERCAKNSASREAFTFKPAMTEW